MVLKQVDDRPMDAKPLHNTRFLRPMPRGLLAMLALLALTAGGCEFLGLDDPTPSANTPPPQVAPTPPPQEVEEPVVVAAEVDYERPDYPGQIRRNPFLPDMGIVSPASTVTRGDLRPREPLEEYSITQLSLVAIISETTVPKAMFIDPKGFGHLVKEGDRLGLNGGVVSDIRDNEVEVREVSEGLMTETRMTTLKLRSDQLNQRDDESLSDEEREALRRLLDSEQGRKAARESLAKDAQSAPRPEAGAPRADTREAE